MKKPLTTLDGNPMEPGTPHGTGSGDSESNRPRPSALESFTGETRRAIEDWVDVGSARASKQVNLDYSAPTPSGNVDLDGEALRQWHSRVVESALVSMTDSLFLFGILRSLAWHVWAQHREPGTFRILIRSEISEAENVLVLLARRIGRALEDGVGRPTNIRDFLGESDV